ncbi:flagellar biosynthetic protein FliR [Sphingomonas adhaesiva]|uniref:flagellar biosynthetic protein FliR n=1 Tax=Sphingomonas adhaesiva TaxID=28212 RepID=UPI002FFBD073
MPEAVTGQIGALLLAALRLGPVLAFAPPFTLVRMPMIVRAVLVVALAAAMPTMMRDAALPSRAAELAIAGVRELGVGIALALALQIAFAMIAVAGRALDIQAAFGLAFIIDPKTGAQTPLIGALFTYAAAAVFFATGGPLDVVRVLALSYRQVPLGSAGTPVDIGSLLAFLTATSVAAFGLVGLAVTLLFVVDLTVALSSRTMPQMNVLVLGFQVKAIVTLLVLPATIGLASAGIARILRLALEAMLSLAPHHG